MKKALLFKALDNKSVQCTACNHYCIIPERKAGICGVRMNRNGILYLLVYGNAVTFNTDPVEKKPLFHFLPGSEVFSLGTIGCNFGCDFCQNSDISQATKGKSTEENLALIASEHGYKLSSQKIVDYCKLHQIPSIAYTYNEPAVFFEYTLDTALLAHKAGIKNVYVSNGYVSREAIDSISPYLDAINIDLKSFSETFYNKLCKASLKKVCESIKHCYQKGIWIELTTLLIPDENDTENEIKSIAQFIYSISPDIPWHISRFFPAYNMSKHPATPSKLIEKAVLIGKKTGLKYVYGGNTNKKHLEDTICPRCNTKLITRQGYKVQIQNIENGICQSCNENIPGIWN